MQILGCMKALLLSRIFTCNPPTHWHPDGNCGGWFLLVPDYSLRTNGDELFIDTETVRLFVLGCCRQIMVIARWSGIPLCSSIKAIYVV